MFVFTRHAKRVAKKTSNDVLARLEAYLNRDTPELTELVYRLFQNQQNAVTYKELREAVLNGYEDEILQWQEDYARFVVNELYPRWKEAMHAGASSIEGRLGDFVFDDSDRNVVQWLNQHGADFVTNVGRETREAIKAILYKGQIEGWTSAEIARYIRPCVGLTRPDAEANARYQRKIYERLLKDHPRMSEDVASQRARDAALKYAAKQHRRRADMIANTELAYAYNRGAHESVRQAVRDGMMGTCVKVWSTAGTERVCPSCMALNGVAVGFDEDFSIKGKVLFKGMHETPPAHPRCRCAVKYKEVSQPNDTGTMLRETMSNQLLKLTAEEQDAITRYTGAMAMQVNKALGLGRINERNARNIALLDSALSKGTVTKDIIVLRKTVMNDLPWPESIPEPSDKDLWKLIGRKLSCKTFISTSLTNFEWPLRNIFLYLSVPAGYKGALYIKELARAKYKYQDEILFNRRLQYIITSVKKEGDAYVLNGEIV